MPTKTIYGKRFTRVRSRLPSIGGANNIARQERKKGKDAIVICTGKTFEVWVS